MSLKPSTTSVVFDDNLYYHRSPDKQTTLDMETSCSVQCPSSQTKGLHKEDAFVVVF